MEYMKKALEQAKIAYDADEVPVGCIIVKNNEIIAKARNTTQEENNATCHAEINAINMACDKLGCKTLDDCEMYVTLEPCAMCSGAIINARIKRLYIGAQEPKSGCCGSVYNLFDGKLPWKTEVYMGFCEDESKILLKKFFDSKR